MGLEKLQKAPGSTHKTKRIGRGCGSGMGKTNSILKAVCPAAAWLPGKRLQSNESTAAVRKWVNTLKI